jgi:hypothetical protein
MSETAVLVRLDDTDLTLADPADDVRGKSVVDTNGDEVGEVDGLIIDQEERRVRLLQLSAVLDRRTVTGFYDFYGYSPYWHAGYTPPRFPYRTR